jgi:hypothetical protein
MCFPYSPSTTAQYCACSVHTHTETTCNILRPALVPMHCRYSDFFVSKDHGGRLVGFGGRHMYILYVYVRIATSIHRLVSTLGSAPRVAFAQKRQPFSPCVRQDLASKTAVGVTVSEGYKRITVQYCSACTMY